MKSLRKTLEKNAFSFITWIRTRILRIREIDFYDITVLVAIVVYGVVFSYFTILKHNVFQSYAWDLGIFDQALFSTLHGKFLYYTAELYLNPSGCYFAQHISPILLLVLPFYAIRPSSTTLLVFKSFMMALGAFPLYLVAYRELRNKKFSMILVLVYLLYPPLQAANWFDFQQQIFLPLFLFSSYYFIKMRRWKLYFLTISLALMVEEHISIIVFVLSACMLIDYRKKLLSSIMNRKMNEATILIGTMVLCVVWFILALWLKGSFPINPQFIERYKAIDTFSVLGVKEDPLLLPVYVLLNPQRALDALMYDYPVKFLYIVLLFGSLVFLPFKSKLCLGVFVLLAPFLLSNYWAYYTIGAHYPLYLIALVFLATIDSLRRFHPNAQLPILKIMLVVAIIFIASTSPLSPLSKPFGAGKRQLLWYPDVNLSLTEDSDSLHNLLRLIPPEASVLTQNHIFPHVSARLNAYVVPPIPYFENDTIYIADLISKSEYILIDMWGWDYHTVMVFDYVVTNGSYGIYALGSKSLLFRRAYQGPPIQGKNYAEYRFFQAYKDLLVISGQVVLDAHSKSGTVALCPQGFHGLGVRGPYTYLLPGTYNITFLIKAEDTPNKWIATLSIAYTKDQFVLNKTREVYGSELKPNEWMSITLTDVTFDEIKPNVEFLVYVSGETNLFVDGVVVTRVSGKP